MKIEEEKTPSFTYLLCITIALFAFSIYATVGFWDFCYHLIDHFINDTPVIIFDRGGAFGLGCSIGLFAFGFAGVVRVISGKKAPDFIERKCIFLC